MNYDSEKINSLAKEIDLINYISQSHTIAKYSRDRCYIHCPKHIDKTASLCINKNSNYYHCFSCGRTGNLVTWLMDFEGLKYNDAVKKILKISGMKDSGYCISDTMGIFKQYIAHKHEDNIMHEILDFETQYRQKYLEEIPTEWVLEDIPKQVQMKYNVRIDAETNRIVYPVYDNEDNFIGVKGRTRIKDYKNKGIPKYINYYKIGTIDYFQGMHENKNEILSQGRIIIVEGIKSVMKLDSFGYGIGVSSETSCLNSKQIKILLKMRLKEIIIAYDKDVGIDKIIRNISDLRRFANVSVVIDRNEVLDSKDSPVDKGIEVWENLYTNRIIL